MSSNYPSAKPVDKNTVITDITNHWFYRQQQINLDRLGNINYFLVLLASSEAIFALTSAISVEIVKTGRSSL